MTAVRGRDYRGEGCMDASRIVDLDYFVCCGVWMGGNCI